MGEGFYVTTCSKCHQGVSYHELSPETTLGGSVLEMPCHPDNVEHIFEKGLSEDDLCKVLTQWAKGQELERNRQV